MIKKLAPFLLLALMASSTFAQYTKLLDFSYTNGSNPKGSLISDGTFLYGMTHSGGINHRGTIFKIKSDGTGYSKLLDFDSINGSYPNGDLFSDGTYLYGMTKQGGTKDSGVVFKIKPDGTGYSKLLDFMGNPNGSNPKGSLISDGTFLYGMTSAGGTSTSCMYNGCGVIFKIKPDGTGYTKLLEFAGVTNGSSPVGSLIFDGSFLYGMTNNGGISYTAGTIFKIKPDGTGYSMLADFGSGGGSNPQGNLFSNGTFLYGMTKAGGSNSNAGVAFKIKQDGTEYSDLLNFAPNSTIYGGKPDGSFISDGTFLYGMTKYGGTGPQSVGIIFRIKPDGTEYYKLLDFAVGNGSQPTGSLVSDGTFLYGMTELGGTNGNGVIFKYCIPSTLTQSPTICVGQSITIGTHTYTTSGNFTDVLTSYQGCDSTVITHLTVNDNSVSVSNATLTANASGAVYHWINCNNGNTPISGQTNQSFTATSNGNYAVIVTQNSCSDTSMCTNLTLFTDVWPGDANHDSIVNNNDLLPIGLFYGINGSPRSVQGDLWQADPAVNWGITENNGSDIKNADCNGNGTIDVNDTLAINLNFNLMHAITTSNNYNGERLTAPDIYFITNASSYNAGDWMNVEVWLGNSGAPVNNLYGIAFNINYNSSLVQPSTESITYPASWLGTPGTNTIKITKIDAIANTAYGAVTRINQTNASGFGKIADFKFQVKTTLVSTSVFHFSISDYMADNAAGVSQIFNTINDSVAIIAGINEINTLSGIVISPNPFNHQTTITFNEEQKNLTLKIMDELGKAIKTINFSGKQLIIEKGEIMEGLYFVQIIDENKNIVNRKIIIQ